MRLLLLRMALPFQSTHPVRGGTGVFLAKLHAIEFQSTHPVRGGTRLQEFMRRFYRFQSTHPVRGGTLTKADAGRCSSYFNPPTP